MHQRSAPISPDDYLIRLCDQHIENLDAYLDHAEAPDGTGDRLWVEYRQTLDAIGQARPRTLQGVVAKARAAKAEAEAMTGGETPENGPAVGWAWDIVNDLLRILAPTAPKGEDE